MKSGQQTQKVIDEINSDVRLSLLKARLDNHYSIDNSTSKRKINKNMEYIRLTNNMIHKHYSDARTLETKNAESSVKELFKTFCVQNMQSRPIYDLMGDEIAQIPAFRDKAFYYHQVGMYSLLQKTHDYFINNG